MILQIIAIIMGIIMLLTCGLNARTRRETGNNNLFLILMLSLASIGVTSLGILYPRWWSASICVYSATAICFVVLGDYNTKWFDAKYSRRMSKINHIIFWAAFPIIAVSCIPILLDWHWYSAITITPLFLFVGFVYLICLKDTLDEF